MEINRRTAAENEFVVLKKVRVGCSGGRKKVRAFPTVCHRDVHRARAGTLWAARFLGTLSSPFLLLREEPWVLRTCKPSIQRISQAFRCISTAALEFIRVSFLKHEVKRMKG